MNILYLSKPQSHDFVASCHTKSTLDEATILHFLPHLVILRVFGDKIPISKMSKKKASLNLLKKTVFFFGLLQL